MDTSQVATFCFFLELWQRWGETPVDCEYDDRGVMDTQVAFLDLFEEVQGLA